MTGRVENLHALVPVTLHPAEIPPISIDFVLDTGFTGMLTLPPGAVNAMKLPLLHHITAGLADGSSRDIAVHALSISWGGLIQTVRVLATGTRPLLGTALLAGSELTVHFVERGSVGIVAR